MASKFLECLLVTSCCSVASCREEPIELDIEVGLMTLCHNHSGSACMALGVTYHEGLRAQGWLDREGAPRRVRVVSSMGRDEKRAIEYLGLGCTEGVGLSCELLHDIQSGDEEGP